MTLNEKSSENLIKEASRRLEQLKSSRDSDIVTAAGELQNLLREPDLSRPVPKETSVGDIGIYAMLPAVGVASSTSSSSGESLWGIIWHKIGLPDPHLFWSFSAKDLVLTLLITLAATVFLLRISKKTKQVTEIDARQRIAMQKLATAVVRKPKYQTSVFQCMSDYEECCRSGKSSRICLAFGVICLTKEVLPFT